MKPSEQSRFDSIYQQHLNVLRLQGKADATIDAYSRAVRRVSAFFDCCPDTLNQHQHQHQHQLRDNFSSLLHSHSWSTMVQWALQVDPPKIEQRERLSWHCKHCGGAMHIVSTYRPRFNSG